MQVKLCKNTEANGKENVTVLSRIKGAPENTAYQDITKCDVFRKKGAFSEINSFTINSEALKSFDIQKSEVKKAENYINFLTENDTKLEIVNKKSIKTTDNENIETEEEKMTETPEETTDTEIDKLETEGDTENEFIYNINDSVIVRYFQRKN